VLPALLLFGSIHSRDQTLLLLLLLQAIGPAAGSAAAPDSAVVPQDASHMPCCLWRALMM
jgi:hypothetical protein